eukprot:SAG31_NODE_117_length_24022_cov_6.878067_24_plen_356_part_00
MRRRRQPWTATGNLAPGGALRTRPDQLESKAKDDAAPTRPIQVGWSSAPANISGGETRGGPRGLLSPRDSYRRNRKAHPLLFSPGAIALEPTTPQIGSQHDSEGQLAANVQQQRRGGLVAVEHSSSDIGPLLKAMLADLQEQPLDAGLVNLQSRGISSKPLPQPPRSATSATATRCRLGSQSARHVPHPPGSRATAVTFTSMSARVQQHQTPADARFTGRLLNCRCTAVCACEVRRDYVQQARRALELAKSAARALAEGRDVLTQGDTAKMVDIVALDMLRERAAAGLKERQQLEMAAEIHNDALLQAKSAIDLLDQGHIHELRCYHDPPEPVRDSPFSVLSMLQEVLYNDEGIC